MSSGKVDRIQLELTSCEGQILSDEIGAVGIRSNMVIIHLQGETKSVAFSGSESRVLRLYDSGGNVIADSNPKYEGGFTVYPVPLNHKLIGFNGNLKHRRNL